MSTITAILGPDADGTLHVPLPVELRSGKGLTTATLKAVMEAEPAEDQDQFARRKEAVAALKRPRAHGTFRKIIENGVIIHSDISNAV